MSALGIEIVELQTKDGKLDLKDGKPYPKDAAQQQVCVCVRACVCVCVCVCVCFVCLCLRLHSLFLKICMQIPRFVPIDRIASCVCQKGEKRFVAFLTAGENEADPVCHILKCHEVKA